MSNLETKVIKFVIKEEIEKYLSEGWVVGNKIKTKTKNGK